MSEDKRTERRIAFKNKRINGWLEDMLVTSKRGELMQKIRDAYRSLNGSEQRQAFIDALDDTTKWYIARDATYMDVIRFGEALQKTGLYLRRGKTDFTDAIEDRKTRFKEGIDIIPDPVNTLINWRVYFNHPETESMPEPKPEFVAQLFGDAKALLNYVYPNFNFVDPPTEAGKHDHQPIWHPGMMIDQETPSLPPPKQAAPKIWRKQSFEEKLDALANVSCQCHSYQPNFKEKSFDALLGRAINFRHVRVGGLLRAIHNEKVILGELTPPAMNERKKIVFAALGKLPIFDPSLTYAILDRRRRLAHNVSFDHMESIFSPVQQGGVSISSLVQEEMRLRHFSPNSERLQNIPNPNELVTQALIDGGIIQPTSQEKVSPSRRRFTPITFGRVARTIKDKLDKMDLDWRENGDYILLFEPPSHRMGDLTSAIRSFLEANHVEATLSSTETAIRLTISSAQYDSLVEAVKTTIQKENPPQPRTLG